MKILFILHFSNPIVGAAWTRIEYFAKYLKSSGHHVNIAGAFSLKSFNKAGLSKLNGINLINITPIIMTTNTFSLIFNILSSLITSIPLIGIVKSDIIVISVPPGEPAFGSFLVAKLFKKKIVIDYRDEWEDHLIGVINSKISKKSYILLKKLMDICYRNSESMITVTEGLSNSLFFRNIKNVKIIPNGADCNIFRQCDFNVENFRKSIGFNKDDFIIVYSGGIGGYYRIDVVIKALKKINSKLPHIKLLIVGYGSHSEINNIIKLSKEVGIFENISFMGTKIDKTELSVLISCCNVGIIPYDSNQLWKNSLPAKSFEYLACGLPIIATVYKDSLLGKLIENNEIGMISEPENIEELANIIEKIYFSDLQQISKKAINLIKQRYDRNIISKELLNLLENIIKL